MIAYQGFLDELLQQVSPIPLISSCIGNSYSGFQKEDKESTSDGKSSSQVSSSTNPSPASSPFSGNVVAADVSNSTIS